MFCISLKMIKLDHNMSELWQIVCKKYNFNSAFVGFIVLIVYICTDLNNFKILFPLSSLFM
jgi:hypothetical protein